MNAISKICLITVTALCLPVFFSGCGCGFDCNSNSNEPDPASLTLALSDQALEQLKEVVITIDRVTFVRSGGDNVVVDTFTIPGLGLEEADTFQLDLLDYLGRNTLTIITGLEMDVGSYSSIQFELLDADINFSYALESDDVLKEINVAAEVLTVPGFSLSSGSESYVVDFNLAQALQYRRLEDDYLLASDGIRVEDTTTAARLSGSVDSSLFNSVFPCDEKEEPESDNRIYIYSGISLADGALADVYTGDSSTTVPAAAVAPFAVASLYDDPVLGGWQYIFGFLPAGSYTLAMSCNAVDDDPVDYNDIVVPLPVEQIYEIELSEAELATCDLATDGSCS
jgi:hypothetical protein